MAASRNVISANLRAELARRNISRKEVAERLGVTPQAVSMKLSGIRPISVDEVATLAEMLGVHPGSLFEQQVPA